MNNIVPEQPISPFERMRHKNADGGDYWNARELAEILDYATDYRNFESVIAKAQKACFNSGQKIEDHFVEFNEMVEVGSGAKRARRNTKLSRYACYLIIENANPAKEIIARGQTYFAVQTRIQELSDEEIAALPRYIEGTLIASMVVLTLSITIRRPVL